MAETKIVTHPIAIRGNGAVASGWDPYEVWRTRVLAPRLADQERDRLAPTAAVESLYVVAPRIDIDVGSTVGDWNPDSDASRSDSTLWREAADVLGWLLVAGVAGVLYAEGDRRRPPPRYLDGNSRR